jgi:hypothetical protein
MVGILIGRASHRALREMIADALLPERAHVRSSKYLNNVIEQKHRNIKSRTNVMLGFKRFRSVATTTSGIELMHRIRKVSSTSPLSDSRIPRRPLSGMLFCSINKISLFIGDVSASPAVRTRTVMAIEVPYFHSPDFTATPEYGRTRPRRSRGWWSFPRGSARRRSPLKFSPCGSHLQSSFNPAKVLVISLPDC